MSALHTTRTHSHTSKTHGKSTAFRQNLSLRVIEFHVSTWIQFNLCYNSKFHPIAITARRHFPTRAQQKRPAAVGGIGGVAIRSSTGPHGWLDGSRPGPTPEAVRPDLAIGCRCNGFRSHAASSREIAFFSPRIMEGVSGVRYVSII